MTKWKHDDLQDDLAAYLRESSDRMVWTNMQMGSSGSPRPDVFACPKSYTRFTPRAYEVKVSVADFQRDVTAGKWQSYLRYSSAVTFAVPAGLIGKADLPPGCGLIVRGPEGWRTLKAPTLRVIDNLPLEAWIKLLLDGIGRQGALQRADLEDAYRLQARVRREMGLQIGTLLSDRDTARAAFERETKRLEEAAEAARTERERILKEARESANREASRIDTARADLAEALGLPRDAELYTITHAAARVRQRLEGDAEVLRLRRLLDTVQQSLAKAIEPLPEMVQLV